MAAYGEVDRAHPSRYSSNRMPGYSDWPRVAARSQSCPPWRGSQSQGAAILVHGAGWLLGRQHGAADGHDQGGDAIDALGRCVLGRPESPAGSWATATLDAIQRARRHQRLQGQHPRRRRQRLAVRECRLPPDPRCRSGDQIDGRGGNDNLSRGSALDTKFSARARTSIIGGSGANQLDGGAGADTFRLFSIFDRQGRCDSTSPDHRLQAPALPRRT